MPLMSRMRILAAAGFSLAVLGSSPPAQAEVMASAVEPRAERILRAALLNVSSAKTFSFKAEIVKQAPLDSGQRIQYVGTMQTYVRRPDRLATSYEGEDRTSNSYYDGKVFTLADPLQNVYATWEAPATLDALFDTMKERIGFAPPLSALLREGAGADQIFKGSLAGIYVGRAAILGTKCHHLAFTGVKMDLETWIAEGEPLLKRVVLTFKSLPGAPQFMATFLEWDLDARVSDYQFSFDPPAGANRIEFMTAGKP